MCVKSADFGAVRSYDIVVVDAASGFDLCTDVCDGCPVPVVNSSSGFTVRDVVVLESGFGRCLDTLHVQLSHSERVALLRAIGFSARGEMPLSLLREKIDAHRGSRIRVRAPCEFVSCCVTCTSLVEWGEGVARVTFSRLVLIRPA